jgi:drug/metabolite transporter (DMT)-like permease
MNPDTERPSAPAKPGARVAALAALAMIAFAGNSLLCRTALRHTGIDAASFTSIRLASGAIVLGLIARARSGAPAGKGNWPSAFALFAYAAGFSFAYGTLPTATGALLLFGAVQATMIGHGVKSGERFRGPQVIGFLLALAGLTGLLLPGLSAPPPGGAAMMLGAGAAWGVYSLRGRGAGDPTRVTAGNFLRAVPFAAAWSLCMAGRASVDIPGIACAVASGAVASGIGYAIWYAALPRLEKAAAATVQLSVPVLAALGGVLFLGESVTPRLLSASAAILAGIVLVIRGGMPVSGNRA